MVHAVRTLERAGADCIQFEDQVAPKRCGHFAGKQVISIEEAVTKIKAAVDARQDAQLMIMARTDACAAQGFEAAVERAQRFAEAGADILFVEAVTKAEEVRALPQRLAKPQLMNMVIGGRTPIFNAQQLGELGYGIVLYANAALQGAVAGMQKALTVLRDEKEVQELSGLVTPFAERQRLVGKPDWDALKALRGGVNPAAPRQHGRQQRQRRPEHGCGVPQGVRGTTTPSRATMKLAAPRVLSERRVHRRVEHVCQDRDVVERLEAEHRVLNGASAVGLDH